MYTNVNDIIIKPNMVVTSYDEKIGYFRVAFVKAQVGTVAVYSSNDMRNILVSEGDTVGHFFGAELLPQSNIVDVMDFNQTGDSYFIYKKVSMTIEEIEDKLNITRGSLHIKGRDGGPIRYKDEK